MSAAWKFYGAGLKAIARGDVQLATDTLFVLLCTSGYTPDPDTHDFRNDVIAEVTGAGYAAGGNVVGALSFSYDAGSGQARIVVPDVSWPASTIAGARVAVLYKSRGGSAAADELIAYAVNDADRSTVNDTMLLDNPSPTLFLTRVP